MPVENKKILLTRLPAIDTSFSTWSKRFIGILPLSETICCGLRQSTVAGFGGAWVIPLVIATLVSAKVRARRLGQGEIKPAMLPL